MRILAVDTATEVCGIGLAADGRSQLELIINQGITHTKILMEGIHSALALAQWHLTDLDALAVTCGPGSFTGLRIGVSTMKGIARALDLRLVGVSSLDVLARQAPEGNPLVCPMIDARRREVYWSMYRRVDHGLQRVSPEQVGPAVEALDRVSAPCLFIGNGARLYAATIRECIGDKALFVAEGPLNALRPCLVAELAAALVKEGAHGEIASVNPVYLRKSDAESSKGAG